MPCFHKYITTCLCLILGFLSGCVRKQTQLELSERNVVVILIDALRADHLPFYGYPINTAPFLTKLASQGVVFEQAFSASSYTAPSTASIFTALYPTQHGVLTGMQAWRRLRADHQELILNRIPKGLETMPEVFRKAGYKTYGVTDNLNISKEMGFDRGFDQFASYNYQTATVVNETVRSWANAISMGGKYFMYLHYMEPHVPYHRRKPWFKPSSNQRARTISAYDSEISFVDEKIKELSDLFQWEKNAVIVIIADHGEEFWEHGGKEHALTLYREVLHVPFVLYASGLKPLRIGTPVSVSSLLPTLADLLGLPANPVWQLPSLAAGVRGGHIEEQALHAQLIKHPDQGKPSRHSVIYQGWHYILSIYPDGTQTEELYRLDHDFAETKNLISSEVKTAKYLRTKIHELRDDVTNVPKEEIKLDIDQDTIRQLKTLGYME